MSFQNRIKMQRDADISGINKPAFSFSGVQLVHIALFRLIKTGNICLREINNYFFRFLVDSPFWPADLGIDGFNQRRGFAYGAHKAISH